MQVRRTQIFDEDRGEGTGSSGNLLRVRVPQERRKQRVGIESLPVISGIDRKRKSYLAHTVREEGKNLFAIAMVSREIELAGYT